MVKIKVSSMASGLKMRSIGVFAADLSALLTNQLVQPETDLLAAGAPSWR